MSPDEATRSLADAVARGDSDAVGVAVAALQEPARAALKSAGLPGWWLEGELSAVLVQRCSLGRGWAVVRGELRAFVRRSYRATLDGTVATDARLARLRVPSARFVQMRERTRERVAEAWVDSLLDPARTGTLEAPLSEVAQASLRAFESSRSRDGALRAAVEAIVRCNAAERAWLLENRTPRDRPTALAAEYVSARELRVEGTLHADGTVVPRPIQTVVVEATLDAVLGSSEDVFASYCAAVSVGTSLADAQRQASEAWVELLPFLELDLRRALPSLAPFLPRTKLSERELIDYTLDRLRVRGVRPEGEIREPYRLLLTWLRSTAKRRAVDAYRARPSEVDPKVLDDLEAEASSNLRALEVDDGDRGAGWWLSRLEEALTPSLRETLRLWRSRESISSAEIAVELGLVSSACITAAMAGDPVAQGELKRACNNVDTRRKRIREHARRLFEAEGRSAK